MVTDIKIIPMHRLVSGTHSIQYKYSGLKSYKL